MSTSFSLMSDPQQERSIALRFWGGMDHGLTVRFAFPEVLFKHLKNVEIVGEDCSTETIESLFNKAGFVEFLAEDVSPNDHLAWGFWGTPESNDFIDNFKMGK